MLAAQRRLTEDGPCSPTLLPSPMPTSVPTSVPTLWPSSTSQPTAGGLPIDETRAPTSSTSYEHANEGHAGTIPTEVGRFTAVTSFSIYENGEEALCQKVDEHKSQITKVHNSYTHRLNTIFLLSRTQPSIARAHRNPANRAWSDDSDGH